MVSNAPKDVANALAALERFIVENDDLLTLESMIGRFNVFDALGVARREINHSNFLAFILDPAESHGQGQLFLKALLMDLLKAAAPDARPLSPIDLDGADLRGVMVRREWRHIDLLITCKHPAFAVVIENKVDAKEHSNQLSRYADVMREHYPDSRPLYVYLTPTGGNPTEAGWVPYSYVEVHRVLARVRTTYHNAIGEDILVFLDHYLNLIGTRFMNDPKIAELCQRIYKNHRQALQLIFEHGSPMGGLLAEVDEMLREDPLWHVFYRAAGFIDFAPAAWLDWLPPLGMDYKNAPQGWLVLRFELRPGELNFYVQVNRMQDLAKRRKIVEALLAEGATLGFKRKQGRGIKDNYTRVSGRERVLTWREDEEPEPDSIREAAKKKLNELFPKLAGVPDTLRTTISSV